MNVCDNRETKFRNWACFIKSRLYDHNNECIMNNECVGLAMSTVGKKRYAHKRCGKTLCPKHSLFIKLLYCPNSAVLLAFPYPLIWGELVFLGEVID